MKTMWLMLVGFGNVVISGLINCNTHNVWETMISFIIGTIVFLWITTW